MFQTTNQSLFTQCGAPVKSRTLSWGSHKSNVTMVYDTQITTVFMGFINQVITGGHHIAVILVGDWWLSHPSEK